MSKRTRQLLNENNALENRIQNPENKEILTNMVVYIRAANISPYDQEKVRRDITGMILDGEHRGAHIKEVIGEDYRLFCDAVIAEIPKPTGRARILSFCRDLFLLTGMLLALWLFFQCIQQLIKPSTWPYATLTAGNLISGLLILALSTALVQAICKNAFPTDTGPKKKEALLFFLLLFFAMLLCMGANAFITYPIASIHLLFAVGSIALLFILYKILDAKLD